MKEVVRLLVLTILGFLVGFFMTKFLFADTIFLHNGNVIKGTVMAPPNKDSQKIHVYFYNEGKGGTVILDKKQVKKIVVDGKDSTINDGK